MSSSEVAALTKDGTHRVDVGLYLQIRNGGAKRSWLLRYRYRGEHRNMGLGSARLVTLTEARRKALAAQRLLLDGVDPREARDGQRSTMTFAQCAEACIAAKRPGWSNDHHAYQWTQSLETFAFPVIGKLPVEQVTANHIVKVLEPIWSTKSETAGRVRNRIEAVLDWAENAGQRSGKNPARWRGGLEHRLPPLSRVQTVTHYVALPYSTAPATYARLVSSGTASSKVLRMIMLTALRVGEVLEAQWEEFDLKAEQPVWVVPASRMKARVPHRVPLSAAAVALLEEVGPKATGLVFSGQTRGVAMTNAAMRKMLRKVSQPDADTHGLRSTFRDWAAEQATAFPREVAEMALAHTVGTEVERAYLRSDLFDQRAKLMAAWSTFVTGGDQ